MSHESGNSDTTPNKAKRNIKAPETQNLMSISLALHAT